MEEKEEEENTLVLQQRPFILRVIEMGRIRDYLIIVGF